MDRWMGGKGEEQRGIVKYWLNGQMNGWVNAVSGQMSGQ